jgi:hypothetical protein
VKLILKTSMLVLLMVPAVFSQDPVSILSWTWSHVTKRAAKSKVDPLVPAKPITPETKNFQRRAREQRTDNPTDPYEASIEGRSAAMERAVQESRAPQPDDQKGYLYDIDVRNDSDYNIDVVFWEFQFTEIANPNNIVRRQFLCAAKMKKGDRKELSVFSLLGPSDTLTVESLASSTGKLFHEKAQINRLELSDGNILQRHDWKYSDVKDSVKRATSTPWGNEVCRPL